MMEEGEGEPTPPQESDYVSKYQVQLSFPAVVLAAATAATSSGDQSTASSAGTDASTNNNKVPKTSHELIQMRLLEAGVQFEAPVTLGETVESLDAFCRDLEKTGCFNRVAVQIGGGREDGTSRPPVVNEETGKSPVKAEQLHVVLDEKDWYRLHLGGGVKAQELLQQPEMTESSANGGPLPVAAELEASAGVRNLAGVLDQSSLSYRLDTKGISSWTVLHERPLYTFLPSPWRESLLETTTGSRFALTAKAALDTMDYEYTRSYKEYQRLVSVQLSNQHSLRDNPFAAALSPDWYASLSWSFLLRDIVPRRVVGSPWLSAASHGILQEAGPSTKHSLTALARTNGTFSEGPVLNPIDGWQAFGQAEVATPPGDVSFVKVQTGASCHVPVSPALSLHWLGQVGWMYSPTSSSDGSLSATANTTPSAQPQQQQRGPTVSDRFHIGGPLQIPGFLPAGIGPRDTNNASATTTTMRKDSLTPGGDSIGGDLYYRTSLMASVPALTSVFPDGRAFGFVSAGTCVQQANLRSRVSSSSSSSVDAAVGAFLGSTRASLGVGYTTTALAGSRLEVTYAWPLRYAPVDGRRNFQLGIGVSLG